ncbi:MAG: hypothetical protein KAJ46_01580, partial [Sedimentisphaerales bacterium]|nr:hypothetical protein [Sedimentisphaerales bacterium]
PAGAGFANHAKQKKWPCHLLEKTLTKTKTHKKRGQPTFLQQEKSQPSHTAYGYLVGHASKK